MSDKKLAHLRVAILASDGFEQAELEKPRKALEEAGAKTLVIAPKDVYKRQVLGSGCGVAESAVGAFEN